MSNFAQSLATFVINGKRKKKKKGVGGVRQSLIQGYEIQILENVILKIQSKIMKNQATLLGDIYQPKMPGIH